jgi:hypothetical protein
MLTFKKIALLGAAGLAAFSISCSDSEGSDLGGTITGFGAADGAKVALSGTVKAEPEGNTIVGITGKAGDNNLILEGVTLPAASVNLANYDVSGVCTGKSGAISVKFEITATFASGEPVSASTSAISINCGGGGSTLDKYAFTLGFASPAHSYVDLDNKTTLSQSQATANPSGVDLVAYAGASVCADGLVCSPWTITTFEENEVKLLSLGSYQAQAAAVLNSATSSSDLQALSSMITLIEALPENAGSYGAEWGIDEITISTGMWFLVQTTANKLFAVKVVSNNVAGQTANFEAVSF